VPILFELTILLSAFGSILGMLHLNRLPRHNHPVFESDRFRGASDDRFFISIEAEDPKFSLARTRELLESVHPAGIEVIEEGKT
jgi:ActD protein